MLEIFKLFENPVTAVPAWLISLTIVSFIIDKLAQGKLGEFLATWFSRRAKRSQTREDTLFSIVREMIEERGRESDELEGLIRQTRDEVLARLNEVERDGAGRMEALRQSTGEKFSTMLHKLQEQRNIISQLNTQYAQLTDETREKFEKQDSRLIEIKERVQSVFDSLRRG